MHIHDVKKAEQTVQANPPLINSFVFSEELNAEFLNSTYGENLDFGKKMFSIFLQTIDQDIKELKSHLAEVNYAGIGSVAHKIKNNFTWVGLPQLSSLMYELEIAAKASNPNVKELYANIEDKFKAGHRNIESEYQRLIDFLELETKI